MGTLLVILVPLVGFGVIVALIKGKLGLPTIAYAYTALMVGLGLILTAIGGAYLLKVGFGGAHWA